MGKLYRDLVRTHSKAKGSARALLNILADYANDEGLAWPTRETMANDTGLSERTVTRCLQALCDDGRLAVEDNAAGGRGRVPVYRILIPELIKGDSVTPFMADKRVTNGHVKGDNVTIKGDKSVAIQSHARSEPQEPNIEPREKHALPSRNCASGPKNKITFKSPHVNNDHFDIGTGFIAEGTGATPVEVYYERFDVQQNGARLNAIKEDDLVRYCKDLDRLREVITAYSQTNYLPGNVRLILDWYRDGVPEKHRPDNALQKRSNSAMFLNFAAENGVFYGRTTENQ